MAQAKSVTSPVYRSYPTNAARGGAATLVGSGNAADIFTFAQESGIIVQNNTAATIYVAAGEGASSACTQGDEALIAGAEYVSPHLATWVALYGAAGTKVNGTTSGQIVLYGVN